jgi:hypothetical protein
MSKVKCLMCYKCTQIIGRTFSDDTVSAARYVSNILRPFVAALSLEDTLYGVFRQDSAKSHAVHASLEALREVFFDRVIKPGQ